MGKGLIKSHDGEGLYTVSIQYDYRRIAKRIADLTADIARLDQQISEQAALVADLKNDFKNYSINHPENTVETLTALVELRSKLSSAEAFLGVIRLTRLGKARTLAYFKTLPETVDVSAWCADLTTDLSGTVGLIEVPNERGVVQVRPGYEGRATYNIDRDGILQKPAGATPFNFLFNFCIFPGWQKWRPTYRHGVITSLSGDTCDVTIDPAQSSQQGLVINQEAALTSVPIEYMNCNGAAFEVGDHVVIQFSGDWKTPKVIGFVESPASCTIYLRIFVNGAPLMEAGHDVSILHGTKENEIVSPVLKTDADGYVGPFAGIRRPAYCLFHGAIRHEADIYTPLPMTKPIIGGKTVDCYKVEYSSEYLYLYLEFPAGSGNICATVLDLLLERAVSFDDPDDPVNKDRTVYEDCTETYSLLWNHVRVSMPMSAKLLEKFIPVVNYTAAVPGMWGYNDSYENPKYRVGSRFLYTDEFGAETLFPVGYRGASAITGQNHNCCIYDSPLIFEFGDGGGFAEYHNLTTVDFSCSGLEVDDFGICWWKSHYWDSIGESRLIIGPSYSDPENDRSVTVRRVVSIEESGSYASADNSSWARDSHTENIVTVECGYGDVGSFSKKWAMSAAAGSASYTYDGNGFYSTIHSEGFYFKAELFVTAKIDVSYTSSASYRNGSSEEGEPPIVVVSTPFEITKNGGCTEINAIFVSAYKGQRVDRQSNYLSVSVRELVDKAVKNSTEYIRFGNVHLFDNGEIDYPYNSAQGISFPNVTMKGCTFRRNGKEVLSSRLQSILDLVNAERAKEGIAPLTPNYHLCLAAQRHASDLARHDYRGVLYVDPPPTREQMHTGTDGSDPIERMLDTDFTTQWLNYVLGENIMSQTAPDGPIQDMIDWWMNSPGHRANIMNPDYEEAGMAEASAASGWTYVVNTFGNINL